MSIVESEYTMKTKLVTDNGKTLEVRREIQGVDGIDKTLIVVTERPVLTDENITCLDSSWMHLQNHMKELGIGIIRLVNLFSTVWVDKPLSKELKYDTENLFYIEKLLDDPADGVIIAWGNGYASSVEVAKSKLYILKMLKEKKVENVYHLVADGLDPEMATGVHPLYLGLRYGRKQWGLEDYPVDKDIAALENQIKAKPAKKAAKKKPARAKKSKDDSFIQVEVIEDVLETA